MTIPDAPATPLTTDWRTSLTAQLDALDRWFQDRFRAEPEPGRTPIPATRFLDVDFLREFVDGLAALPDGAHVPGSRPADYVRTIAASRFARWYSASVTSVALAGLANGVGIDVSPERTTYTPRPSGQFSVSLDLADEEILRCAERPTGWAVRGPTVATLDELREHVWERLYGRHLKPVFTLVRRFTKASEALLWTSAAEYAGMLADAAEEYLTPEEARPFLVDRQALFEAPGLPGVPGPNPLRDTLDYVPHECGGGFPETVQTRRMCCLNYLLGLRSGRLCQNCPHLSVEDRVALVRERHGVPVGTPGGPAAERAQAIGLRRTSHRLIDGA